jgi:hypothetical protein
MHHPWFIGFWQENAGRGCTTIKKIWSHKWQQGTSTEQGHWSYSPKQKSQTMLRYAQSLRIWLRRLRDWRCKQSAMLNLSLILRRNIEIVFRYANGKPDQLEELASELFAQKPDLLLAVGGDVIKPLFNASKGAIPIVGGLSDSPMRAGVA